MLLCRSQVKRRHPTFLRTVRLRRQQLHPEPPHHNSGEREYDHQDSAAPRSAGAAGEQIVVQRQKTGNQLDTERNRIAEIFSRVWIEQAMLIAVRSIEGDVYGLVRFWPGLPILIANPGYARATAAFNSSSVKRGPDSATIIGSRVAAA